MLSNLAILRLGWSLVRAFLVSPPVSFFHTLDNMYGIFFDKPTFRMPLVLPVSNMGHTKVITTQN